MKTIFSLVKLFIFLSLLNIVNSEKSQLVNCQTSKGPITIEVHSEWAPLGAERFLELVTDNFYTNIAMFRCVQGFLVQFGISEDPSKKHWHSNQIKDDPNLNMGIKKNYVSFAGGGKNTRSTQLFIAFEDLDFLGHEPWETPFGIVVEGIETLQALYTGYGDIPPFGEGPDQREIYNQGNAYIHNLFPDIDFIHVCSVQEDIDTPIHENLSTRPVAAPPVLSKEEEEEEGAGEEEIIINELSKPSTSPTIQNFKFGNLRESLHVSDEKTNIIIFRAITFIFVCFFGLFLYRKYYYVEFASKKQ